LRGQVARFAGGLQEFENEEALLSNCLYGMLHRRYRSDDSIGL